MRKTFLFVCGLMLVLGFSLSASAALITNTAYSTTGFPVSNSDLIEGSLPTVNDANLLRVEEGVTTSNPAALTNGSFGPPGLTDPNEVVAIHSGAMLTYALDTLSNPYGYDITNINTYAGWRDGGRDAQDYSIFYSTVEAPLTFLTLVNYDPVEGCPSWGCTASDSAVYLSDDSGVLASGVASIQFRFENTENGYVGYRELDVIGNRTSVPEPATMLLLSLGLVGLMGAGRNKLLTK